MRFVASLIAVLGVLGLGGSSREIVEVDRQSLAAEAAAYDELLVYFYATWCAPCQAFAPVFESLAERYSSDGVLGFAKFNGGEDRGFAGRIVGDAYPGVALWRKGQFYLHARTEMNAKGIDNWIQQYTGAPVEMFPDERSALGRAADFRVTFVSALKSQADLETLERVAWENRHFGKFVGYFLPAEEHAEASTVRVKHQGEKERVARWSNAEELHNFCDSYRFPLLGPVDDSNQHLYFLRGLDPVMVYGTAKDIKPIAVELRKLAVAFQNELSFMWFDTRSDDGQKVARAQGVYSFPNFVTFLGTQGPQRDRKRFVYPGDATDMDELKQWLKSVRSGDVRPQVQSTSFKPSDRTFDSDVVTWVTGDNFERQVFHSDADFLLLLSAPRGTELFPGCLQCEAMLKQLDFLVKKVLPKDAPLKVGELLVTANEIPLRGWGGSWELSSLPTIYFIPAGQNETFVEWPGFLDVQSLLTRWESDTQQFKQQAAEIRQAQMPMAGPIDQEMERASDKSVSVKEEL